MRIATWNINGLKARLEYLKLWLHAVEPDVVALQELKMTEEQFPRDVFTELGYEAAVHGQKGWNGVAVLSRHAMTVTQVGLPSQDEMGSRLITVDLDGLSVTSVYAPNGKTLEHEDYERKLGWFDALAKHLEDALSPSMPSVVAGDFNIVPKPIDSWNEAGLSGQIFHTREERARISRLESLGLTDAFRHFNADLPGFSWWDYRAGSFHKGMGLRIDLVLATATLLEQVSAATVSRDWRKKVEGHIPSDHAPVWIDLKT